MRGRWLLVIAVASLCLNVAVIGTFLVHRVRRARLRRFPAHGLAPEVREKLRRARETAVPEFAALADKVQDDDSLLWVEMAKANPDSLRVDSLSSEVGRFHGRMRAMVFRQMHRELQLMPVGARAEYLQHMMMMRPGLPPCGRHASGGPGRGMDRHMRQGSRMSEPREGEPPPGPPESGD
jgi:hypothetical protein